MTHTEKLLTSFVLVLASYCYILNGYASAAIFLNIVALTNLLLEYSIHAILKNYLSFIFFSILYLYLSYSAHLEEIYSGFNIVLLLSVATFTAMKNSSFSALRTVLKVVCYIGGTFICLAFILPSAYNNFFFTRIMIIILIFCPFLTTYAQKYIAVISLKVSHKR